MVKSDLTLSISTPQLKHICMKLRIISRNSFKKLNLFIHRSARQERLPSQNSCYRQRYGKCDSCCKVRHKTSKYFDILLASIIPNHLEDSVYITTDEFDDLIAIYFSFMQECKSFIDSYIVKSGVRMSSDATAEITAEGNGHLKFFDGECDKFDNVNIVENGKRNLFIV